MYIFPGFTWSTWSDWGHRRERQQGMYRLERCGLPAVVSYTAMRVRAKFSEHECGVGYTCRCGTSASMLYITCQVQQPRIVTEWLVFSYLHKPPAVKIIIFHYYIPYSQATLCVCSNMAVEQNFEHFKMLH